MSVTIKDIAKELNLSKTTVSFVLSGIGTQKGVSKQTQERILEYVNKINYQPNQLAQSLISGVTKMIGVLIPSIGDVFYAKLVKEIEREAEKNNYTIIIASSERIPEREVKLIRAMRARQVDGMVIAATEHSQKAIARLLGDKFPFVLVDRIYPELETNYVIINDIQTTYTLVGHLIGKGCRRVALITTDTKVSAITDRLEGYRRALDAAGIPFDPSLYCEVPRNDYSVHVGRVVQELFDRNPDVDGFCFTAHYLASEAVMYMYKSGMDIGKYGMASIHENSIVGVLAPRMNIARIPLDIIGKNAVDILLNDIRENGNAPKSGNIISPKIIFND